MNEASAERGADTNAMCLAPAALSSRVPLMISTCCETWLPQQLHIMTWHDTTSIPSLTGPLSATVSQGGLASIANPKSLNLKADKDRNSPFRISPLLVPVRFAFLRSLELMLQFQQLLIQLVHALRQLLHLASMPLGYCTLMITQDGHLYKHHLTFHLFGP